MSNANRFQGTLFNLTDKLYAYGIGDSFNHIPNETGSEAKITNEENESLSRAFTLLDIDGDGVIELPELERLLISLGRLPFDDNLAKILSYAGAQGCEDARGMDCRGFRNYLVNQMIGTNNEEELRKAFEIFDTNPPTGKLNIKLLRQTLKTVGAMLTDDEIDFLFKEEDYWMLDEKDTIQYQKLIDKLLDRECHCKFLDC